MFAKLFKNDKFFIKLLQIIDNKVDKFDLLLIQNRVIFQ